MDDCGLVMGDSAPVEEVGRIGDQIAELAAHLDAASARLLDLIREFDTRGGWNNGFRSCAEWLSFRIGLDIGAARERVRVARALGGLPGLAAALARGELSYAKVRALTRVATPETESRLLAVGRAGTAMQVEQIVRGWRRIDRQAERDDAARQHAARTLDVHQEDDGTVVVRGRLSAEAGAMLMRALEAARETLYQQRRTAYDPATARDETPSFVQQQADALVLVAESALAHGMNPGAPAERYQVVVHVDAAVLANADAPGQAVVDDGMRVPAETAQRLACDASRVVMRHDADGAIVEIGAKTRAVPPAIRRALQHRDRACRFPGCHVRAAQAHHIQHWAAGGPTTLSNLLLLCRRHHRAVHEEGWGVTRDDHGRLSFTQPNGRPFPEVVPITALPDDPTALIKEWSAQQDIGPHSLQATDGTRLNLGYALDVLHPLSNPLDPPREPGAPSPPGPGGAREAPSSNDARSDDKDN
jgi:hypothetical protein